MKNALIFIFYFFNRKGRKGVAKVAEFFLCACPACPVTLEYQGSEAYRGSLRKNLAFFAVSFFHLFIFSLFLPKDNIESL